MGWRFFLVLSLSACGLTLDLDEVPDSSFVDVSEEDAGIVVDGAVANDVAVVDGGIVDGGIAVDGGIVDGGASDSGGLRDGMVVPFDTGDDAFLPCDPVCPLGQFCSGGICVGPCGDEVCFEGQVCIGGECVRDCGVCPAGHVCGFEGRCVCESECGESQRCSPDGACVAFTCDGGSGCADPVGEGCREMRCEMGICIPDFTAPADCLGCDPLTGEAEGLDGDGDGFPACMPMCVDELDSDCDCDDDNPFINPDAFDAFTRDRNCDGIIETGPTEFCVEDTDADDSSIVRPSSGDCEGETYPARALLAVLASLRRLDCDDDNPDVHPHGTLYYPQAINGDQTCDAGRGECYDYNCDAREEREHPIFAQCFNARAEAQCEGVSGWVRDEPVPACGFPGLFIRCEWREGVGCRPGVSVEATQRCR